MMIVVGILAAVAGFGAGALFGIRLGLRWQERLSAGNAQLVVETVHHVAESVAKSVAFPGTSAEPVVPMPAGEAEEMYVDSSSIAENENWPSWMADSEDTEPAR